MTLKSEIIVLASSFCPKVDSENIPKAEASDKKS